MNPAATIAIYFEIVPRYEKADAELHIVDFGMEPNSGNPKIVVKLRNSGGRVAFLKRANLRLDNVKVTKDREREASEIVPVAYDWLISREDLSRGRSAKSLSRRIDSNDVDVIEFQIAFEELRTTFN